jgi:hypothetical protein
VIRRLARLSPCVVLVACLAGCAHRVPAAGQTVDVLDFIVGDASLWPRVGTQVQQQVVDVARREVCWIKYGRADEFECWTWDETWIRHEVDHAIDGRPGVSYMFSDERWLPRRLRQDQPWSLDVTANRITWFDSTCLAEPSRPFPYLVRARWGPVRDLGPDLGVRDTIVLEYAPHEVGAAPGGEPERFYFARGAGWFLWSSDRGVARFDRVGGRTVSARGTFCARPGRPS